MKGLKYQLNEAAKTATVTGAEKKSISKVTIPATVKVNGKTYQVTAIQAAAFNQMTTLKTLTIGKNILSIGASAFDSCTKLKTVKIQTRNLKLKQVGANAFRNNPKKAVYTCPDGLVKSYKKILTKRGASKQATYK